MKLQGIKKKIVFLLALALAFSLAFAGCSAPTMDNGNKSTPVAGVTQQGEEPVQSNGGESGQTQKVKLYFSDDQAMYLVPEEREIAFSGSQEDLLKKIVEELVKGPTDKNLYPTMPEKVAVHSVKLEKGLATVDFSPELKSKHSGGSTGENFTVFSLVDTLTEFPEVTNVQILIDGQKIDTLAGHLDTSEPFIRDNTLIKK